MLPLIPNNPGLECLQKASVGVSPLADPCMRPDAKYAMGWVEDFIKSLVIDICLEISLSYRICEVLIPLAHFPYPPSQS